jgi:hypothetical protein
MLTRTKWWRGLGVAVIASVALSACEDTVVNVPPQPEPPAAPITITITPAQLNLTTGQTQQVVATVTGGAEGTSRAVTYSSSNTAVATVAATGVVTAVGPGAASIVATAAADATVRAAAGVTVTAAVVPPTPTTKVTIQSITEGVTLIPVNPDDVDGLINVNLNVERGNATQLRVLLNGQEIPGCTQNFGTSANEPAPLTAEGLTISAQTQIITCSLNTDRFSVDMNTLTATVAYPNANYVIRAELRTGTTVHDAASTGTLRFNNADMMQAFVQSGGHAGFPNSIIGQDALQWHAGNITFNVVPVIYSATGQGVNASGYPAQVTLAMTGRVEGNLVTTSRNVTTRTGGGFVVTFPGTQGGTFADGNVNQFNSTSAGSPITANSITNAGQPGPNSGADRFRFIDLQSGTAIPNSILRIDNERPEPGVLALTGHPALSSTDADRVTIRNGWINGTYSFSGGKSGQNDAPFTLPGVGLATAGTVTYHASTATAATTWAQMDAIANANAAITTGAALEQSLTNDAYVVVARVVDRLGNRSYVRLTTGDKATGTVNRIGADFTIPLMTRLRDVSQYNPGDSDTLNIFQVRIRDQAVEATQNYSGPAVVTISPFRFRASPVDSIVSGAVTTKFLPDAGEVFDRIVSYNTNAITTQAYWMLQGTGWDRAGNRVQSDAYSACSSRTSLRRSSAT